jgi:putative hydrolase of the HAD superfamily
MPVKALILDLDNTIYPVSSVGEEMFRSLFDLIFSGNEFQGTKEEVKAAIMRRPYFVVAKEFFFSERLHNEGFRLLQNMTYDKPMVPFADYAIVRDMPYTKFLVTTGFISLQQSKIDRLGIAGDFEKIFIVDPSRTNQSKKDIFQEILSAFSYSKDELIVIGDDLNSEIKAGNELGIRTVVYDFAKEHELTGPQCIIRNYTELNSHLV